MSALHPLLDPLIAQQDCVWFVAWLAWAGVLAWLVFQSPMRGAVQPWLAAIAVGQVLAATVAILNHAYLPADEMAPRRAWEVAAWGAQVVQAAGLIWWAGGAAPWGRGRRIAASVALALAVGWQLTRPVVPGRLESLDGGFAAMLLIVIAGWRVMRGVRPRLAWVVCFVVLSVVLQPQGPLALLAHEARRWVALSLFALPAALSSTIAGLLAVAAVMGGGAATPEARRGAGTLAGRAFACVTVGLAVAVAMGAIARRSFETALLSRARAFAAVVDTTTLARWMKTRYAPGEPTDNRQFFGGRVQLYRMPSINDPEIMPLRNLMAVMQGSDPLLRFVHIATLHRGEILSAVHAPPRMGLKDVIIRHRDAVEQDHAAWRDRRSYFSPPFMSSWGALVRAWAPLVDAEGAMLGWLAADASVPAWTAVQAQARLQAFALTALGLALLVIAERHRVRTMERAAAQAEAQMARAADEAKTAFLAQVSHELRTPLQSILGYSELLRGTSLEPQQRRWLDNLSAHGGLLTRLMEDLLDLTSLQTGVFRIRPEVGDLAATVAAAVEALRPRADQKRLNLIFSITGQATANLLFDDARIRQVAHNLVANALKFTEAGEVSVTLSTFEGGDGPGGSVRCELVVRDTGCGIEPGDQARLFLPFVRLARTAHREGTGLGLTLCRSICRALGGDVLAASDGRTGSTFTARWALPRANPGQMASPRPAAAVGRLDGLRVLVADDNPFVRALFVEWLRSHGAEVDVAADGEEALARCAEGAPAVAVLDVAMPKLDGYEAARQLRRRLPALRIVGVSAHAELTEPARARSAGMDVFLSKPVTLGDLLAAVYPEARRAGPSEPDEPKLAQLRAALRRQFAAEVKGQLDRLAQTVAVGDWAEVARQAHYLKNSAYALQLPELAAACGRLQHAAAAGGADAPDALPAVTAEVAAALAEESHRPSGV